MTRQEILQNEGLTSFQKGRMLEALPPEPIPRPVMTEEIRGRLHSLAKLIAAHRDSLVALEERERKESSGHETLSTELPRMLLSVSSTDDAALAKINIEDRRLQVMVNFLRRYPDLRRDLLRNLSDTMRELDGVLAQLAMPGEFPHNFFDLQNSPIPRSNAALAVIEMKLRQ